MNLGEEFVGVLLWRSNWLDAHILVLTLVCMAYLLAVALLISVWVGIWASINDEFGGVLGLVKQLLRWFFGFCVFSIIVMVPMGLLILFQPVSSVLFISLVSNLWFWFVLLYGFWWKNWGGRILDYLGDLLFKHKRGDGRDYK